MWISSTLFMYTTWVLASTALWSAAHCSCTQPGYWPALLFDQQHTVHVHNLGTGQHCSLISSTLFMDTTWVLASTALWSAAHCSCTQPGYWPALLFGQQHTVHGHNLGTGQHCSLISSTLFMYTTWVLASTALWSEAHCSCTQPGYWPALLFGQQVIFGNKQTYGCLVLIYSFSHVGLYPNVFLWGSITLLYYNWCECVSVLGHMSHSGDKVSQKTIKYTKDMAPPPPPNKFVAQHCHALFVCFLHDGCQNPTSIQKEKIPEVSFYYFTFGNSKPTVKD